MNIMNQSLEKIKLLGGLFTGNDVVGLKKISVTHSSSLDTGFRADQAKAIAFPGRGEKFSGNGMNVRKLFPGNQRIIHSAFPC